MQPYHTAAVGGPCKSSLKIKESVSVKLKFVTFVSFETQSDCVVEAALKHVILLHQLHKCWGLRSVPP